MLLLWVFWVVAQPVPATGISQEQLKWSAQAEGAAVKLKLQADDLGAWARRVQDEGRIGWLPVLRSSASELVRRAELLERIVQLQDASTGTPEGNNPSPQPENPPDQ